MKYDRSLRKDDLLSHILQFFARFSFRTLLFFVVCVSVLLRLYKISSPVADWHSFRQADTASVTREYIKHGIDLLHPRYHDLSNIQSGERVGGGDNVEGWRMVEFPIVNATIAFFLRLFPQFDLVISSRVASILASVITLIFGSLLVREIYSQRVALLYAFFFATLPYSVFYSRAILPEPFFIAFSILSAWLYLRYIQKENILYAVLGALSFALALLIKPMAIFFFPLFLGIRLSFGKRLSLSDIYVTLLFFGATVPLYLWRQWIVQFPAGIPSSNWLFNGGGAASKLSPLYEIRFRPAWWRWIFYERLTKLFLGFFGQIFFLSGVWASLRSFYRGRKSQAIIFSTWALGSLAYVSVFAAGNVQHDYYQNLLVPFVCMVLAAGLVAVEAYLEKYLSTRLALLSILFFLAGMYFFTWKQVRGFYMVNNWDIVAAGHAIDQLTPGDAKVIAPYSGDTAFLFQTNRTGWPIGFAIEKKISEGAAYYVSVSYDDEARELEKKYSTIKKIDEYIILDLTKEL